MNFRVDDIVEIVDTEKRPSYMLILGEKGSIVSIKNYKRNDGQSYTIYYVQIESFQNPNQSEGLWIFEKATSLKLVSELLWTGCFTNDTSIPQVKIIKKEENKNMEILDLFIEYKRGKINEKYDKQGKKLYENNEIVKKITEFKDSLKDVKGLVLTCEYDIQDDNYKRELEKIEDRRVKELIKINELGSEINAIVHDCETYEQKQNILKAYGVIDEHGKLIK